MTQSTLWQPSDIDAASDEGQGGGEATKKRGRIPQSAWPDILQRHRAGQTLTAIAREFDCTPSAISYIVRKAEAAGVSPAADVAEAPPEKSSGAEKSATPETSAPPEKPAAIERPVVIEKPAVIEKPTPAAAPASPLPAPQAEPARPALEKRAPAQPAMRLAPAPAPRPPAPRPAATSPALAAAEPAPAPVAPPTAENKAAAAEPARPAARVEPPPVDAVEGRLRDTARGCLSAYRAWRQSPGEASLQGLGDAVHELRKVLARLEIDMSASRRNEQATRPIPIPPHRAQRNQR